MGPLINFLTLMVLLFAGLAQTNSIPRGLGYGVAGALELALEAGVERAMDRYNRPGALGCEELP